MDLLERRESLLIALEGPGTWGCGGHCSWQPLPGEALSMSPMSCHPVELCKKSSIPRKSLERSLTKPLPSFHLSLG